jgi:hypothetical protein
LGFSRFSSVRPDDARRQSIASTLSMSRFIVLSRFVIISRNAHRVCRARDFRYVERAAGV